MYELEKYGIKESDVNYYLPPYEWYNKENVSLIESQNQITINFTS